MAFSSSICAAETAAALATPEANYPCCGFLLSVISLFAWVLSDMLKSKKSAQISVYIISCWLQQVRGCWCDNIDWIWVVVFKADGWVKKGLSWGSPWILQEYEGFVTWKYFLLFFKLTFCCFLDKVMKPHCLECMIRCVFLHTLVCNVCMSGMESLQQATADVRILTKQYQASEFVHQYICTLLASSCMIGHPLFLTETLYAR